MANLKSIKSKIFSYKKTGTVTHAMEAVSAVKMRKGQERALSARAYHRTIKVARTIADLTGDDGIDQVHVAEALQYRQSIEG